MPTLIAYTFGGLSSSYLFRQLVFGAAISALVYFMAGQGGEPVPVTVLGLLALNTLLYPYARFVYERIVGFVFGDNVFLVNALLLLMVKLITMVLCWSFALFIAPPGLVYLYLHHRRAARQG